MFHSIQLRLFTILKLSILLWMISITCLSLSYGEELVTCQPDIDKKISLQWPYNDHKEALNADHWVIIEDLSSAGLKPIVWVDIRAKSERNKTPLSNALNLSITELANANFLIDDTVILVGDEFDQLTLDKAINQLTQQGFKHIYALEGGIRGWNKLYHATLNLPNEISPKEFLLGSKTIDWQVISFGLSTENEKKLPEKVTKRFALSEQAIKEFIQLINDNQLTNHSFISVVLVAADDKATKQLQQQLQPYVTSKQVVWLQGGIENYQHYIQQQQNIIASKGRTLRRPCGLTF